MKIPKVAEGLDRQGASALVGASVTRQPYGCCGATGKAHRSSCHWRNVPTSPAPKHAAILAMIERLEVVE